MFQVFFKWYWGQVLAGPIQLDPQPSTQRISRWSVQLGWELWGGGVPQSFRFEFMGSVCRREGPMAMSPKHSLL